MNSDMNSIKDLLYVVDCDTYETIIHRIDLSIGYYNMPKRLKGTLEEQVFELNHIILKDRPSRIIIDLNGYGRGFSDLFKWHSLGLPKNSEHGYAVGFDGCIKYFR